MDKKPIEIIVDVIEWHEPDELGIYEYITVKEALEAIKIAMKQAWIAGFNDSSFSHSHGFLQQNDEGFDEWLKGLEGQK